MVGEKGAAALFITRDIAITAHFCSRIAIIYAGEIVELAETAAFFRHPAHPYSIMPLAAFSHSPALRARWTRVPIDQRDCHHWRVHLRAAPLRLNAWSPCVVEAPTLRQLTGGRRVRCHFQSGGYLLTLLEVHNLVKLFSGSRFAQSRAGGQRS